MKNKSLLKISPFVKKFLLSLTICLSIASLCACGKKKEEPVETQSSEVINSLSSQGKEFVYLTSSQFIDCFKPVDITLNNWQEYLGFKEIREDEIDEFLGTVTGNYKVFYIFAPKEGLENILLGNPLNDDESLQTITFHCHYKYRGTSYLNKVATPDDSDHEGEKDGILSSYDKTYHLFETYDYYTMSDDIESIYEVTSKECEITSITGQLMEYVVPSDEKWNVDAIGNKYLLVKSDIDNSTYLFYEDGSVLYGATDDFESIIPSDDAIYKHTPEASTDFTKWFDFIKERKDSFIKEPSEDESSAEATESSEAK